MLPQSIQDHPEFQVALAAARLAGDVLLRYFRHDLEVNEKGTNDLVTNADLESEQAITTFILSKFPGHQFLAEEQHQELAAPDEIEHLWIVDPLDGTTNYAHGIPHFAVSIAYYRFGVPECGVIFNPVRDELYVAVRGAGAYGQGDRLAVGQQQQLSAALIGVGFYYDRGEMMRATLATVAALFESQIRGIRRFGTASLDLCQVAAGSYGAFFEYQLSPWDFAAGRLLVEEAGGQMTTATGERLPIAKTTLLASNSHLHQSMLCLIDSSTGAFLLRECAE